MRKSKPRYYEFLDHTADIGIRVWGATPEELFVHAAEGMLDILMDGWTTGPVGGRTSLHLTAPDPEALLIKWLQAILYVFDADRFVATQFTITRYLVPGDGKYQVPGGGPCQLEATIAYAPFDPAIHHLKTELKAVTYHQLSVRHVAPNHWEAVVIFDV